MNIAFTAFGCKVNISEDESFASEIIQRGYTLSDIKDANIIVVNTCAVTDTAAKKCENYIYNLKKKNPNIKIIATGCLASSINEDLKKIGADIVVTNGSKESIIKHITSLTDGLENSNNTKFFGSSINLSSKKTRAFFKIQDGCDANCTYCIIPKLRGNPESKKINDAVNDFKKLLDNGYKEIVLVGIHIGMYGRGLGYSIYDLVEKISNIDGNYRIRLTSLECNEITDKLIDLISERKEKICPHLHIPLQSGSNEILKKMGRFYESSQYIEVCNKAKSKITNLTIGSDVIVGFPSESEENYLETINTLKAASSDFIHVFPYSDRFGTIASLMDNKISEDIKKYRADNLRNLWQEVTLQSMKKTIGKEYTVLTEKNRKGHTENYFSVKFNEEVESNKFVKVIIDSIDKSKNKPELNCKILK